MAQTSRIAELMSVPAAEHGVAWITDSLQEAVRLEFATIPPYLSAMWSIKSGDGPAYDSLREIVVEEMLHLGLVCNLLTTLGVTPKIWPGAAPDYPCPLPGGVRPGLIVSLGGLTPERVRDLFMQIEKPHHDLVDPDDPDADTPTIGEFYAAIRAAVAALPPEAVTGQRQLARGMGPAARSLSKIDSAQKALDAIDLITEQGEGTTASPRDPSPGSEDQDDLAHFYRFAELYKGRRIVQDATGKFVFSDTAVPFPETYPLAEVPHGGWQEPTVTPTVAAKLKEFDAAYSTMLTQLQAAWEHGDPAKLGASVLTMHGLTSLVGELIGMQATTGGPVYGPCFRAVAG
jgi:hypothetical protein